MEDYSVGSLSDLITGANTPNKKKVVKKQFSQSVAKSEKRKIDSDDDAPLEVPIKKLKEDTIDKSASPKKKKKSKKNVDEVVEEAESPKKKKKSKKNVDEVVEEAESPKKKKKSKKNVNEVEEEAESPKKKQKLKKSSLNSSIENDVNGAVEKKSKNDLNAERRVKKKQALEQKQEDTPEQKERTIFVGNLPLTLKKDKFKKFFAKYGTIDTVRFRGVPVANPKTSKKVALIKKEFHPERTAFYGFVRYTTPEEAIKAAAEANGVLLKEHHLRVHRCSSDNKPDESKAIFVGNLGFNTEDDELWKVFGECGEIVSVRIVRDGQTGMGKGFGYVNFKESDSVTLALEMENVEVKGREVRISLCNVGAAKKNRKTNKTKKISKPGAPKRKAPKETNGEENESHGKREDQGFQGSKFSEKKKKNKFNKGLAQKKKMIKKIAPQ